MNWLEPIDAYCERIDASLLGEPLNALSNAAFFAAAIWAAAAARRTRSGGAVWALIVLVALIGAGSLAFHVFANRWSVLADVIPITVFIYAYLAFALRRFLVMNWPETAMSLVALFAATLLVERATPPGFLNGSGPYLPALAASAIVSITLKGRAHAGASYLLTATVVLLVSIVFRTIDLFVCPWLPVGTHFVWHVLNGLVLALYLQAAIRYGEPRKRTGPGGGRRPGPSPEA